MDTTIALNFYHHCPTSAHDVPFAVPLFYIGVAIQGIAIIYKKERIKKLILRDLENLKADYFSGLKICIVKEFSTEVYVYTILL